MSTVRSSSAGAPPNPGRSSRRSSARRSIGAGQSRCATVLRPGAAGQRPHRSGGVAAVHRPRRPGRLVPRGLVGRVARRPGGTPPSWVALGRRGCRRHRRPTAWPARSTAVVGEAGLSAGRSSARLVPRPRRASRGSCRSSSVSGGRRSSSIPKGSGLRPRCAHCAERSAQARQLRRYGQRDVRGRNPIP